MAGNLAVVLILAIGLGSGSVSAEGIVRNGIAAIVNDSIITYKELDDITGQSLDLLRRTHRGASDDYQERYTTVIKEGLDQLISRQLILEEFKSLGGALDESVIEDEIKDRIRRQYGDRATLTQTLQQRGMTYESFRQRTREEIIINFMRARNVSAALIISPAKIERYYTNHLNQYQLGEQVKLRMITLTLPIGMAASQVADLALEIRAKIDDEASFKEMASVYSDPSSRHNGGDWDWIERSKLSPGLSDAAFNLKQGEMSDVLSLAREPNNDYWILHYTQLQGLTKGRKYTSRDEFIEEKSFANDPVAALTLPTPLEFYLMLVEARREPRTRALEEVRDELEKELLAQEKSRLEKKWIDRLAAKSFVVRY